MPRRARIESGTGIYHVLLRGNNKQQIFYDEDDCIKLLNIIALYKQECDFKVFAYCLMGNHIHLLLCTGEMELAQVMRRIAVKFVRFYNKKYERVGHLFQDRFKSEPVENDQYLLQVIRYIHQNPVKAGISRGVSFYKYSSYRDYMKGQWQEGMLTDIDFVLGMVSLNEFKDYHKKKDFNCSCIDITDRKPMITDDVAIQIIDEVLKDNEITNLCEQPRVVQLGVVAELKNRGLSIRQISRLTGITKKIVEGLK